MENFVAETCNSPLVIIKRLYITGMLCASIKQAAVVGKLELKQFFPQWFSVERFEFFIPNSPDEVLAGALIFLAICYRLHFLLTAKT